MDAHRSWLLIHQSLIPGLINLVFNGVIAWLLMRQNAQLTLWGEGAFGPDLLITGVLLPLIICLINSRTIPTGVINESIPQLARQDFAPGQWHRRSHLARAFALAGLGLFAIAVPTVVLLRFTGPAALSLWTFVGFKAIWAGLLAALVSPIAAWWALAEASEDLESGSREPNLNQSDGAFDS